MHLNINVALPNFDYFSIIVREYLLTLIAFLVWYY